MNSEQSLYMACYKLKRIIKLQFYLRKHVLFLYWAHLWSLADPGGGGQSGHGPFQNLRRGANMFFGPPPKTHESDMHISLVSFEHIYFMCAMVTYQLIFTK